jgi:hypothetical protein
MTISKCTVDGFLNLKRRNGTKTLYCEMHYARFLRNGEFGVSQKIKIASAGLFADDISRIFSLADYLIMDRSLQNV